MKTKAGPSATQAKSEGSAPSGPRFRPPFKPRPGLFYGLVALLIIWVAGLVTLYFLTVYPQRGKRFAPIVPSSIRNAEQRPV